MRHLSTPNKVHTKDTNTTNTHAHRHTRTYTHNQCSQPSSASCIACAACCPRQLGFGYGIDLVWVSQIIALLELLAGSKARRGDPERSKLLHTNPSREKRRRVEESCIKHQSGKHAHRAARWRLLRLSGQPGGRRERGGGGVGLRGTQGLNTYTHSRCRQKFWPRTSVRRLKIENQFRSDLKGRCHSTGWSSVSTHTYVFLCMCVCVCSLIV